MAKKEQQLSRTSEQKIALICAEINSLRKQVENNGSSALKFDNALVNGVNAIVDVCNQFERGIELAESIGDVLAGTINGSTPLTEQINTALNSGLSKLPSIPLAVGGDVSSLISKVFASAFEDINADLEINQLCEASPTAFGDVEKRLSLIPNEVKTNADKCVDELVKNLDFNSVLKSTKNAIQKKSVTCVMKTMKQNVTRMDTQISQQTQNILNTIMPNISNLNPFNSGGGINGLPFSLDQIPGLNSESTTLLTQAGNLASGSSALFYFELGCEIAKQVGESIETVNDFINRFENFMPSDAQLQARLDRLIRQQTTKLLQDISGLTIGELEILQQECGDLFG
jgi:hypothetical protein